MKNMINKVLSPRLFAVCYLPYLSLHLMTVINVLDITRFFLAFFAAWGAAICVKVYLCSGKQAYLEKHMAVLILFLVCCLVSQFINFQYGGVSVIGKMVYFSLCILILYAQYKTEGENYLPMVLSVSRSLSVTISAGMLVSLLMYFNLYHGTVVGRSGTVLHIGVAENRLYGVFTSANVGGMYALILIWCALINLSFLKKTKFRPLWITLNVLQILVAMAYMSVALSRGTYLAGVAFLIVFLLLRAPFEVERKCKGWQQAAIRAISVVLCFVIAAGSQELFRTGCVKIAEYTMNVKQMEWQEGDAPDASYPGEEDVEDVLNSLYQGFEGRVENQLEQVDITNKRKDIWLTHLSLLKGKAILFGVNEPSVYYAVETEKGTEFTHEQFIWIDWAGGNMHNGYLQILVHCGIFAFAVFMLFLGICLVRVIRYLSGILKKKDTDMDTYRLFALSLSMVATILVNNVIESNMVLMGANFFQAVFWFAAGTTVFCLDRKGKK